MRHSITTCTLAVVLNAWAAQAAAQGAGPNDKPTVDRGSGRPRTEDLRRRVHQLPRHTGARHRHRQQLVRSVVILRDRYGSELGPFLKKGHQMQSGQSSGSLTEAQVKDLAHFIRQRVNDTLRGSPIFQAQNVLTGDPKAGAAYFDGEGKCSTCHSTTGNLADYGTRYPPVEIQQRFVFPPADAGAAAAEAVVDAEPHRRRRRQIRTPFT